MPSLREIRASIRNQLVGQVPKDDVRFRNAFIDKVVRDKRSLLIREAAKAGLGVDPRYYQDLACLEVKDDRLICEGEPVGVDIPSAEIPATEGFHGSISYLGTSDLKTPFHYRSISSFLFALPNRRCRTEPIYTVLNGKVWFRFLDPALAMVRMVAVLEDPKENKCVLDFEKQDYPVPNSIVHTLEVLCLKQLLSTANIPQDQRNDAKDGTVPERQVDARAIGET